MMDILLFISAGILIIIGLVGTVVPGVPGSPCSYLGLVLVHLTSQIDYSTQFLVICLIASLVIVALDYLVPAWCTKKFGGSKWGVWGSIIGLIVGLLAPIPFGFIIGPFVGAFVGELIAGKETSNALRSGVGSFIGFLLSTGAKLALALTFTAFYIESVYDAIKSIEFNIPSFF